jgi:hypothetical protein
VRRTVDVIEAWNAVSQYRGARAGAKRDARRRPANRSREQVIAHLLLDELGALLLGCAARTPQPDREDVDALADFEDEVGEQETAEPLALRPVVETHSLMSAEHVAIVHGLLDALAIEPSDLQGQAQPTLLIPALTIALSAVGGAAARRQAPAAQALGDLAAAAAAAAAGIEIHLTDRPPGEAQAAVRAHIDSRAMATPPLLGGPVMRHSVLTEITGDIARRARQITTEQLVDPASRSIAAWQDLRDRLLHLASVALKAAAAATSDPVKP